MAMEAVANNWPNGRTAQPAGAGQGLVTVFAAFLPILAIVSQFVSPLLVSGSQTLSDSVQGAFLTLGVASLRWSRAWRPKRCLGR
jgi:hypothetical protein